MLLGELKSDELVISTFQHSFQHSNMDLDALESLEPPVFMEFLRVPPFSSQEAAWNCRRIGPGCSPSLLCEPPNGDLYSFKSSLCSLETLGKTEKLILSSSF